MFRNSLLLICLFTSIYVTGQHLEITLPIDQENQSMEIPSYPIYHEGQQKVDVSPGIKYDDVVVGQTWYDLQTYNAMQQRIYAYPDGNVGLTWMMGFEINGWPDRGTGYNFYNGQQWSPYPSETVEGFNTAWPCYAPLGENGELIAAFYNEDPLWGIVFNKREEKGQGEWETFYHSGPPNVSIAWPAIITNGPDNSCIHLLVVTLGSEYNGQSAALLYSRSQDGGETWDIQNELFTDLGSDYLSKINGDGYSWAQPIGNTLAFSVGFWTEDGYVMKSHDNGDNWEKTVVYDSPFSPYPEICLHSLNDLSILKDRKKIPFDSTEETKKIYTEDIIPYWKGKTIRDRMFEELPQEWKDAYSAGVFTEFMEQRPPGHTVLDDKIYKKGMLDFIEEIDTQLNQHSLNEGDKHQEKIDQLEAMKIAAVGIISFAKRHADELRELAAKEDDTNRKEELEQMATICSKVPANKPDTFWEALQYYWFIHVGVITEVNPWDSFNPGRLDQHLQSFYSREIENGTLTKERAKEILQSFWIKFNNHPAPPKIGITAKESNTYTDFALINLGGVREDGSDAVNDVTYLLLEVIEEMRMLQPSSMVQVSKKNPDRYIKRFLQIVKTGFGQPSIFNTDAIIQEMLRVGKSIEDARNAYMQVLVDGDYRLLLHRNIKYTYRDEATDGKSGSKEKYYLSKQYYLAYKDQAANSLEPKKKEVINSVQIPGKDIKAFLKENDNHLKTESDLVAVYRYCNAEDD